MYVTEEAAFSTKNMCVFIFSDKIKGLDLGTHVQKVPDTDIQGIFWQ